MTDKAKRLMECVDLSKPEFAQVRASAAPAEAFVKHLARPPRPRFRFEYERKAEILAFLRKHYEAWRRYDTGGADRVAALSIKQAQGPRALSSVAELGKAWWATGDPKYGAAFERFYLAVPTGQMFDWDEFNGAQGALELDPYFLLLDCSGFTTDGRIAFLDHLHAISCFAWDDATSRWQQLMLGPEGHNWYLHGMHVLPFIGLLFPEFKRSSFFLRTGWSVVEEHLRGHYRADGGARETTLGYQNGSLLSLWDFYLIAHRNGHPMSGGFVERLLHATKFVLRLMTPAASTPSFGDSGHHPGSLTRLSAVATALTGDRECKWYAEYARKLQLNAPAEAAGEVPLCAFWSVGLEGAAAYASTRPRDPHHSSALMGPTGYAALRSDDGPKAHYMAIAAADRGPIVTSHGHNEVFSLEVHADGIRFIGEMGCAPYGTSLGRRYDESTEAHSCLAIVGMQQATIVNEWRWSELVIPCVRRWISEDTHDFFHGVHEGYYKYPHHLTLHARKVLFVKPAGGAGGYWIVMDWLESNVKNDYRAYFHGCVPGRLHGRTILLGEPRRTQLAIIPPAGDPVAVRQVRSAGLAAYIREKRLDARQYPCFAHTRRCASDCLVYVLMPLRAGEGPPRVSRLPAVLNGVEQDAYGATAVEIRFKGRTDLACVSHKDFDAQLQFGGQRAWGLIAFRRIRAKGRVVLSFDHSVADGVCGR